MSEMSLVQGLREEIELLNRKVAIRDAEIKLLELWLADWKERARAAERPLIPASLTPDFSNARSQASCRRNDKHNNKIKEKHMRKYTLTEETVREVRGNGRILNRIKALVDIPQANIKAGDVGGFIEKESNLSHDGSCWVHMGAIAFDDVTICDNAQIRDNATVCGNACICDDAIVCDTALISGETIIDGSAQISGNALISGEAIVGGKAIVTECAVISEQAVISEEACISGEAHIFGNVHISGNAWVRGNAQVSGAGDCGN